MIISALSIQTILSLVAMASESPTSTQMIAGLDLPSNNLKTDAKYFESMLAKYQNNPMLHIANAIYVGNQYTIQPQFAATATSQYFANVQTVNYGNARSAAQTINTWVLSKTDNKIQSLIQSQWLSASTDIVLVNAVYFNGLWEHPFHKRMEPNVTFFNTKCQKSGKVNMMSVHVCVK